MQLILQYGATRTHGQLRTARALAGLHVIGEQLQRSGELAALDDEADRLLVALPPAQSARSM